MNLLITGGASGLGLALTKAIAEKYPESKIYFTYFKSVVNREILESTYSNVSGIQCNFANTEDVASLVSFMHENQIAVLINNAFTGLTIKHFHNLTESDFLNAFKCDVIPTLEITKAFISIARKRKSGKIITILSANIAKSHPIGLSIYVANKNYLLSMHKSWAAENKSYNISSNCVSPEFMATPLNEEVDERIVETMIGAHPLKKLLTVEEVADTVLFLCSASSQLNGQNIILNAAQV